MAIPSSLSSSGGIARIMGGTQFLLPQAAIAYYPAGPGAGGHGGNAGCSIFSYLLLWLVPGMIVLRLVCVISGAAGLHGMAR